MATSTKAKKQAGRGVAAYRSDPAVQQFFDKMARALTSGDGKAAAGLWSLPSLIVSDPNVEAVSSVGQLEKMFGGAQEQYNARGVTDTEAEVERVEWLTDRIALAFVRWPWLDEKGAERGEESSCYVLRKGEDGSLRMHAAVMRGAEEVPQAD